MHNPSITTFNPLPPMVLQTIREVFDIAVHELEMRRGEKAPALPKDARARLARKLVDLAKHGENDAERLRLAVLDDIAA